MIFSKEERTCFQKINPFYDQGLDDVSQFTILEPSNGRPWTKKKQISMEQKKKRGIYPIAKFILADCLVFMPFFFILQIVLEFSLYLIFNYVFTLISIQHFVPSVGISSYVFCLNSMESDISFCN